MRTCCLLLVMLFFLGVHITPGAGLLAGFNFNNDQDLSDSDMCVKDGGSCVYYNCPTFSQIIGTCFDGAAKCCL